jgi:hypothetical protein
MLICSNPLVLSRGPSDFNGTAIGFHRFADVIPDDLQLVARVRHVVHRSRAGQCVVGTITKQCSARHFLAMEAASLAGTVITSRRRGDFQFRTFASLAGCHGSSECPNGGQWGSEASGANGEESATARTNFSSPLKYPQELLVYISGRRGRRLCPGH